MDRNNIAKKSAKILLETQSVLINTAEPFSYTSGAKGPVYVDCRRLISFVKERQQLMNFAKEILSGLSFQYVAGGETAGIPYAAFLSDVLEKPMLYVRKKPKGFGRMAQIEGHFEEGSKPNILLVEDLQRDGGSKVPFVEALRKAGAEVTDSFVVFHYGTFPKSEERMKELNINLHALCTWDDILTVAEEDNLLDKDTIISVREFLDAPDQWEKKFLKNAS